MSTTYMTAKLKLADGTIVYPQGSLDNMVRSLTDHTPADIVNLPDSGVIPISDLPIVTAVRSVSNATDTVVPTEKAVSKMMDGVTRPVYTAITGADASGKYINGTGAVVDAGGGFHVMTFPVTPGDAVLISGSVNYTYMYIFTTNDTTEIIKYGPMSTENDWHSYTDIEDVVPPNATKLLVNWRANGVMQMAEAKRLVEYVIDGLPELQTEVADLSDGFDYITTKKWVVVEGTDAAGKYLNGDGVVIDASTTFHTTTFPVTPGDYVLISGSVNQAYPYIFTTDDTTEVLKGGPKVTEDWHSFTNMLDRVPASATKLIVNWRDTTGYQKAFVEKQDGYTVNGVPELQQEVTSLTADVDSVTEEITASTTVPVSAVTVHEGHFISYNGVESGYFEQWTYVEYDIPYNALSFIVTSKAGQNARLWILKDARGDVVGLSSYDGSPYAFSETVTLSDYPTATKLFVNAKDGYAWVINQYSRVLALDGSIIYFPNGTPWENFMERQDKLYGKILCTAGDSITYGGTGGLAPTADITCYNCNAAGDWTQTQANIPMSYGFQIAERHHMTFYNGGVGGSTMQGLSDKNGFSLANGRYTKLPDNIDYLLIWFGWNDNAYGTLGTINDTTNESFYGGYNVVLPYLLNKYTYTKIGLIVPYGTTEGHRNAVRQLGNKWGVAVWDNYQGGTPLYYGKEASVGVDADTVTANRAKFQADGTHPNYYGNKQLADMIEQFMLGM